MECNNYKEELMQKSNNQHICDTMHFSASICFSDGPHTKFKNVIWLQNVAALYQLGYKLVILDENMLCQGFAVCGT
jgi:hypothetical protein